MTRCKAAQVIIEALQGEGGLVTSVGDRLCSWEHSLASEAAAKKGLCPGCPDCTSLFPVYEERDGARTVAMWCMHCKEAVEPIVDPIDYDLLTFLPDGCTVPSVPAEQCSRTSKC